MIGLAIACFVCAVIPCILYFRNLREFRPPPTTTESFAISVLIPARNEERSIEACVRSVLASVNVDLECIALDDASTDRTAEIVNSIGDARVRLEAAPPLPEGWSGKQHACFALSKLAAKPLLTFLDADVRLEPDALARLAAFQQSNGAALVSGFPRQITGTILEKLLIPLMHFILLGFLPLARMRANTDPKFGAGCGQWFLTTRVAYDAVGGHEAVKASFHDGVKLPRVYRAKGFKTDLCDATHLASCRMYRSGAQVWNGLAKNAREGLGSPLGIWFWTIVLVLGQIVPYTLWFADLEFFAALGLIPVAIRLHAAWRFRQSWFGALFHPLGIALLLGIQWYATIRVWLGHPVSWKGRARPKGSS